MPLYPHGQTTNFSARFSNADEAEACFAYSTLLSNLNSQIDLTSMAQRIAALPPPTDYAANLHADLVQAMGMKCEKAGNTEDAIALYRLANGAATNERLIRLAKYLFCYNVLDVTAFKHCRINHSKLFADKKNHINGIENFWNQAKRHMRRFNGVPKSHFGLFLKECEWRFNNPEPKLQLAQLKQWVIHYMG